MQKVSGESDMKEEDKNSYSIKEAIKLIEK